MKFVVSVGPDDWDPRLRGWRCDVLRLPGLGIDGVFVGGKKQDDASYRLEGSVVRWTSGVPPRGAAVQCSLPEALVEQDQRLSESEKARFLLEEKNLELRHRASRFSAVTGLVAAAIAAAGTYLATIHKHEAGAGRSEAVGCVSEQPPAASGCLAPHAEAIKSCRVGLARTVTQSRSPELKLGEFVAFVHAQSLNPCRALVDSLEASGNASSGSRSEASR